MLLQIDEIAFNYLITSCFIYLHIFQNVAILFIANIFGNLLKI